MIAVTKFTDIRALEIYCQIVQFVIIRIFLKKVYLSVVNKRFNLPDVAE